MSKRGHYPGGHTLLGPDSSWFTGRNRKKKQRTMHPRVKLKRKPKAAKQSIFDVEDKVVIRARAWALTVTDIAAALGSPSLMPHRRQALLGLEAQRREEELRRWAESVKSIPRMLERADLSQAQREILIEIAVERRRNSLRSP